MRRTRRRQGRPISSSQPQFQQVHISLIHINTNYHFCILSFLSLSLSLSFFHSIFPNSHFFQCEASAAPPHVLPLAEVEAAHRDQGSFFLQFNLFQGSRSGCFALVPSFSSTIPYIFMHFPVNALLSKEKGQPFSLPFILFRCASISETHCGD